MSYIIVSSYSGSGMATSASNEQQIPKVGLRYTLRFRATTGEEKLLARDFFVGKVIMGQLHLKVQEVFCIQWNQQEKAFDVTLKDDTIYQRVAEDCRRGAKVSPLAYYEVLNLDSPNFRTVSVHMYNPFVGDGALATFLGQYGKVMTAARYVNDPLGFWTGRRQFQVLLYPDPEGPDGLKHPPALFSLGGDRGYLFYPRQPVFCRKCRKYGHNGGGCSGDRCRFCGQAGHTSKDCGAPKTCHGCGGSDHLFRSCPGRRRTYAEVAHPTGVPDGATEQAEGSTKAGLSQVSQAQARPGMSAAESGVEPAFLAEGEAGADGVALAPADAVSEAFPALTPGTSPATAKQGARKVSQDFGAELPSEYGELVEGAQSKKSKSGSKARQAQKEGKEGGQQGRAADEVEEGAVLELEGSSPDKQFGVEGLEQEMGDAAAMLTVGLGLEFDLPPGLLMLASPSGDGAHEGPSGQSDSPNPAAFSWADEMDGDDLYK